MCLPRYSKLLRPKRKADQSFEKEGANYEAVINKNGKEIGVEMDPNGKVLSKHNEAKEHKEKGEKY